MLTFEGIRVIELGRVLAAPFAGQMLADFGADVIKIETPDGGDMMRSLGPGFVRDGDGNPTTDSAKFQALNRNKRSITVDLAAPEGQEIVRALVRDADVLIENFKVGDLERRGLGYEALSAINPRLIYASISGFGQTGPYRERAALDPVAQAYSGFLSVNGEEGGPPMRTVVNLMDYIAGCHAAFGIATALYRRRDTGAGERLDLSLVDSGLSLMGFSILSALVDGKQPPRVGSRSPNWEPSGIYDCDGGQIYILSGSDRDFSRLTKALDRPELTDDPRFATRAARHENRLELSGIVADILRTGTKEHWVEALTPHGIVAAPVIELAEVPKDLQIAARGSFFDLPHPAGGTVPQVANPVRSSAPTRTEHTPPPLLGQHTDEVLRDRLGMDEATIRALRNKGVL